MDSTSSDLLPRIISALETIHSPHSSNTSRHDASSFLDSTKTSSPSAPSIGYALASTPAQSPPVRHYGLSLLEHTLRYRWSDLPPSQQRHLRDCIVSLARDPDSTTISPQSPAYLRNKTAQLWVDCAKRCWGEPDTPDGDDGSGNGWMGDMDRVLVTELWPRPSLTHKEFVLAVLEGLSEDIFNSDDVIAQLRSQTLSKACVEIFTPARVLAEQFPGRETNMGVRYDEEGWLVRICGLIFECLNTNEEREGGKACLLKALATLRATMSWAIIPSLTAARVVERCCNCLGAPDPAVQMAAVEVLFNLYSRTQMEESEFRELVCPMFNPEIVLLLRKLYEWTIVDVHDIHQEKYLLSKKLSEMLSNLAGYVEERPAEIPDEADVPGFLELLLAVTRNQSLVVSIPILSMWVKLLRSEGVIESDAAGQMIGPLLELCSHRLMRYEQLPEDSQDVSFLFLNEDIDTVPERHAFVGNYRRYCTSIVEIVVRQKPFEALHHILSQADGYLKELNSQPLDRTRYKKVGTSLLAADSQFCVVEAGLKGYMKWLSSSAGQEGLEQKRGMLEDTLESWCSNLLGMSFQDPLIRKRACQVAVAFSTSALSSKTAFMLKVLEHLLGVVPPSPEMTEGVSQEFVEALKELQADCTYELQRLAIKMPDYLVTVYDELSSKITEILSTHNLEKRQQIAYQSFLFTITHRASTLPPDVRAARLEGFLSPVMAAWQSPDFKNAISSVDSFRDLFLLDKVQAYLSHHKMHTVKDWSQWTLDAEGRQLQDEMNERLNALPLRPTKSLLGASTEKVKPGTPAHQTASDIWAGLVPVLLPPILDLIRFSQAFHNASTWSLPPSVVQQILADRFWQAAISSGSRDDFYARVSGTKRTMEGFASSIRGTLRTIRESCYSIIYCLSRLQEQHFYGLEGLPGPLANALLADAHYLSSHQFSILLTMVRHVIDDCPPSRRPHFLPPLVASLMAQMDNKIMAEWDTIALRAQQHHSGANDEDLTSEMKEESILRHLTWPAVMLVASLLDPQRDDPNDVNATHSGRRHRRNSSLTTNTTSPSKKSTPITPAHPPMRSFILSTLAILEPLLLFCSNALRIRDTRSVGVVIRVLNSIIPSFLPSSSSTDQGSAPQIREFLSTTVLRAAITSLHDAYFVDVQRDLAQLIASILVSYDGLTETPIQVVAGLPGVGEQKVRQAMARLKSGGEVPGQAVSARTQRAVVLELLRGLMGVSVAEMGKVRKDGERERSKNMSRILEGFVNEATTGGNTNGDASSGRQPSAAKREASPEMGALAGLFGS